MKVKSIVIALTAALAASASVQSFAALQPAADSAQVLTALGIRREVARQVQ